MKIVWKRITAKDKLPTRPVLFVNNINSINDKGFMTHVSFGKLYLDKNYARGQR